MATENTQQGQQENDRLYQECLDKIAYWENEIKNCYKDLHIARSQSYETSGIYTAINNCECKIKLLTHERDKYCPQIASIPKMPDMDNKQIILSTSSVRRKTGEALVETSKPINKF